MALTLGAMVVSVALVEGALQLGVAIGGPAILADPAHYADPLRDPWFWQVVAAQAGPGFEAAVRAHPVLGWVPLSDVPPPFGAGASAAVVLGDSFLAGTGPERGTFARALEVGLSARTGTPWLVHDAAVGGYCLGQIVLRLESLAPLPPGTPVVVGVMTEDIDRALLPWRPWPKPAWTAAPDGALVAQTAHLGRAVPPPAARVLALARVRRALGVATPEGETTKEQVGRALLRRLGAVCAARGLRCLLVPLVPEHTRGAPRDWRVDLLRDGATGLDVAPVWPMSGDAGPLYKADRHPTAGALAQLAARVEPWVRGGPGGAR